MGRAPLAIVVAQEGGGGGGLRMQWASSGRADSVWWTMWSQMSLARYSGSQEMRCRERGDSVVLGGFGGSSGMGHGSSSRP